MSDESPKEFGTRNNEGGNSYAAAWRAYYQAVEEAGIYVGGEPLQVPETGTTVRIKDGKRYVQVGPYADTNTRPSWWDGLLVYVELNFPHR